MSASKRPPLVLAVEMLYLFAIPLNFSMFHALQSLLLNLYARSQALTSQARTTMKVLVGPQEETQNETNVAISCVPVAATIITRQIQQIKIDIMRIDYLAKLAEAKLGTIDPLFSVPWWSVHSQ